MKNSKAWIFLVLAILCEVTATLSLKAALVDKLFYILVFVGYILSFILLSLALAEKIRLSIAYSIWGAFGVALTAVLSVLIFSESMSWLLGIGIFMVVCGVFLVEFGSNSLEGLSNK